MVRKKTSTHQKNPEDNSLKAVGVLAQNPRILNWNRIFSSRRNNLVARYNSAISKPQQISLDDLWKSWLNILSGLPISPDRDTRDHIFFAGGRLGRPGACVRACAKNRREDTWQNWGACRLSSSEDSPRSPAACADLSPAPKVPQGSWDLYIE